MKYYVFRTNGSRWTTSLWISWIRLWLRTRYPPKRQQTKIINPTNHSRSTILWDTYRNRCFPRTVRLFNNEVKLIRIWIEPVAFRAGFCETCRIPYGGAATVPELLPRVKTQVVRIMRRIVIRLPKIYVALYWWYTGDPDRFAKSLNGVNGRNKDFHRQGIPFVEGDVINFIVVVRPPETQHQLTGRTAYR
jgi:hypothetical protein